MIESKVQTDSLFLKVQEFAKALGLSVIEVNKNVKSSTDIHLSFTIAKTNSDVSIDECETFHKAVLPSLELEYGREALSMEVSTPGIQRSIKDFYEFTVFVGKYCKIYSSKFSSWIEGTIEKSEDNKVSLKDFVVVDTQEKGESLVLDFSEIQKAKLEYKWETAEDKKRKNIEKQKLERRKLK